MSEMQDDKIAVFGAAVRWGNARMDFLRLPAGSPEIKPALGRLADAENALQALLSKANQHSEKAE